MSRHNKDIGQRGEVEAIIYLRKKGYQILQQNFQTHWGEIDIIAKKDNTICFFEVKTRIGVSYGRPHDSINAGKINRLSRPIHYFLLQNNLKNYKLSLDVLSIILKSNLNVENIQHFKSVSLK